MNEYKYARLLPHPHITQLLWRFVHLRTRINAHACCHIRKTPGKTATRGELSLTPCSTMGKQPKRYARELLGMGLRPSVVSLKIVHEFQGNCHAEPSGRPVLSE